MAPATGSMQRIAVFGGGQVALLAATALARALPACRRTLVRTPVAPDAFADAAHTTLPSLLRLHRRIGMPEQSMLRQASGSHWLATRYAPWSPGTPPFFVGHGAAAEPHMAQAGIGRSLGDMSAPADHGPASALARAGAFALPADDAASPLSDLDYALRFDPEAHVRGLLALARHLGVRIIDADIVSVGRHREAGVREVILDDGTPVEADVFVDCTGIRRALIGTSEWTSWSSAIPIDRVASSRTQPALSPLDTTAGSRHALELTSPGRDCTRTTTCWSSARRGAHDDAQDASATHVDPGRIGSPWSHNVIALGDAAAAFPPIGWLNLHLAVVGIELMLDLLPVTLPAAAECREYNRRFALAADRVADFVATHLGLTAIDHRPAASLARTLAEFARRSRLPPFEEETIPRELWSQLLGGLLPNAAASPRVRAMPATERAGHARALADRVAAALAASKPYPLAFQDIIEGRAS